MNLKLWDTEDKMRELERQKDFGADFTFDCTVSGLAALSSSMACRAISN